MASEHATPKDESASAYGVRRLAAALGSWGIPNTGNQCETTPARTFQSGGQDCREYRVLGEVDGRTETIVGTACRDAQGRWINQ